MSEIHFEVFGRPQPGGSKRAFRHPKTGRPIITDQNRKAKPWMQEVAGAAVAACGGRELPIFTGPVALEIVFSVQRPKSHYGTGRNADQIKPSAPDWPAVMPDLTKLVRVAEDALKGIVWRDDAQVVEQSVTKVYDSPEGAYIRVLAVGREVAGG